MRYRTLGRTGIKVRLDQAYLPPALLNPGLRGRHPEPLHR